MRLLERRAKSRGKEGGSFRMQMSRYERERECSFHPRQLTAGGGGGGC